MRTEGLMVACVALALTACAAPGMGGGGAMAGSQLGPQSPGANMMAARANAEMSAARPGDEALTCDQLQAEVQAIGTNPGMQASIASLGATAQAQQDKMKAAQGGAMAAGMVGTAAAVAGSFIPGGGFLAQGAMAAQAASASAQAAEANKDRASMINDTTAMMPMLMRGQRVMDLATAKKCAFMNGQPPR